MQGVPDSSMRAKGGRKARHELEQALSDDKDDHAARFALVQLLAITGEYSAADELLRGPGIEERLLADPTTRVAMLSSLGDAYLNLWQARRERVAGDGKNSSRTRTDIKRGFECRLDVSTERAELLHQAQRLFEDALATPESLNDPAIQVQVAFCKEARGDCNDALSLYASIIAHSPLSPGASSVIFRTSVLLAHLGRFDESVRYLEYIEENPPKGYSRLLVESMLYMCYVAMGLQMRASRRTPTLREAFQKEYQEGRIGVGFSREEIPWDQLPEWFHLWQELGEQSMRKGDYYLGVLLLSQATSEQEDVETLVRTAEMLWVLRDTKRALQLCERAYAADPLHNGAKRRLSAWAPEKWRDTITKEEERRAAMEEMQHSGKKADAMVARRARREKARVLHGWQRLHAEYMGQQQERRQGQERWVTAAAVEALERARRTRDSTKTRINSSYGSPPLSGPHRSSCSPAGGSVSHSSSPSSLFSISISSSSEIHSLGAGNKGRIAAVRTPSPARAKKTFPVPSAEEAARAGRANAAACFRAELKRTGLGGSKEEGNDGDGSVAMASVAVTAGRVREALSGGPGVRCFYTPEMRALARFESARRTHERKNIRAIYDF